MMVASCYAQAFGFPNGQATKEGFFGIDNLTIGKPVPGPLHLLGVDAAFRFSGVQDTMNKPTSRSRLHPSAFFYD